MTLRHRDTLLSRLSGVSWPFGLLLDTLELPPGADVLDIGAGDGRLLSLLRERGHRGRRVGMDPAPGPGLVAGTAEALPFPDASFDAVLLIRVLAHLANPMTALAEARRVLRPAGQLVVAAHGPDHLRETWRVLTGKEEAVRSSPQPDARHLRVPVIVSAAEAGILAKSYGLVVDGEGKGFPIHDCLHLVVEVN
ncbi:class I SAM-dependent methyltransferase [Deinococcus apachensis]|uniref:class I SAM-dependent methyltransferase n=1 Tax=Deinococcus apachensis TaxID=309886 RepID=UPI00036C3D70|nr:methyltransferase domain-containing protein [Deinococcus apachensis]